MTGRMILKHGETVTSEIPVTWDLDGAGHPVCERLLVKIPVSSHMDLTGMLEMIRPVSMTINLVSSLQIYTMTQAYITHIENTTLGPAIHQEVDRGTGNYLDVHFLYPLEGRTVGIGVLGNTYVLEHAVKQQPPKRQPVNWGEFGF